LHEVGTRIAVAQATKKKKVQLQIAESLARRRTRKIGHERLVREAPAEVWNCGVLKKVANTNWTLSFACRFAGLFAGLFAVLFAGLFVVNDFPLVFVCLFLREIRLFAVAILTNYIYISL
jgi:hypothetical protein